MTNICTPSTELYYLGLVKYLPTSLDKNKKRNSTSKAISFFFNMLKAGDSQAINQFRKILLEMEKEMTVNMQTRQEVKEIYINELTNLNQRKVITIAEIKDIKKKLRSNIKNKRSYQYKSIGLFYNIICSHINNEKCTIKECINLLKNYKTKCQIYGDYNIMNKLIFEKYIT